MEKANGVIPHLVVKGGAAAVDFYKAAFGAVELFRMPGPDGKLMHASLVVNGGPLMLCDDMPEHCGGVSRAPAGPAPVTLHLNVPDADATIARATEAGATVTLPADDMFWGDRYGQIVDPFGHSWSISTPLTPERKDAAAKKWAELGFAAPAGV